MASGEKRKTTETKQRGYFACIQTRRLQHERHKKKNKIKLKTNKTTTKKKNKNVQSAQTNPRREKMLK